MTELPHREYHLIDAVALIHRSWKWLVGFGLVGLATGTIYVFFAPPVYEGRAQIELARYGTLRNLYDFSYVSEARILVSRIKSASFFDEATSQSCDIPKGEEAAKTIARTIKPSIAKGTPFLEVAVRSTNKEIIKGCLEAVFKRVEKEQLEALDKIDAKVITKLKEFEAKVAKKNAVIEELKTRAGSIVVYVDSAAADMLLDERIGGLKSYVDSRKSREPIFLNYEPPVEKEFPSNRFVLVASLLMGMAAGMLTYLVTKAIKTYRLKAPSRRQP